MTGTVRRRVEGARRWRAVRSLDSLEALEAYVQRTRPAEFLHYRGLAREKRSEVEAVLEQLGVDVAGRRVLDLGPGHGDSLDVFRERGAAHCRFVERDPLFYAYNRLKGAEGDRFDLIGDIGRLAGSVFDLVYAKGSVNPTSFRLGRARALARWLEVVLALTAEQGTIVLTPWWPRAGGDRAQTWFPATLLDAGFEPLPWIAGHNAAGIYPATFAYRRDGAPERSPRDLADRPDSRSQLPEGAVGDAPRRA